MDNCKLISAKGIIQDPYYDVPTWMNTNLTRKEYFILDGKSSQEDVELFLITLLGYNHIDVKRDSNLVINDLLSQEEVAISGGVLFIGENKEVFPSCCCGLEEWKNIFNDIDKKISPWLGHDPNPGFEYHKDKIRIWSDYFNDKKNPDLFYIECKKDELIHKLSLIEKDLLDFANIPLFNYISKLDEKYAKQFVSRFKEWFFK